MSKKCRSSIQKEELKGIGCISELVFVDVFPTSAFFPSGNLKEPEQEGFGWVWLGLVSLQSENSSAPISHLLRVFPIPVVSHGPPQVRSELIPGWADPRSLPLTERRLGCSKGVLSPREWRCGNVLHAGNVAFCWENFTPRSIQTQRPPISQQQEP